jgi:hypothetical protein
MFIALKLFDDVSRHLNVEGALFVIPTQFDPAVEIAHPILGECILGFDSFDEMINVFLALIFDSKIVDSKGEGDRLRGVFTKAPGIFAFIISVRGKTLTQELVCKDAGLRQTPDGLAHLEINVSTDNFVKEVILGDNPRGKQADGHFHVLVPVKCCRQVEIANVEAHVACLRGADDAIPLEYRDYHISCACGEFPWVINLVAASCDSDLIGIFFLGVISNDDLSIGWWLIVGDTRYVFWVHNKNSICPFCFGFVVSLTHATKIFSKSCHLNFRCCWV